MGLLRKKDSVKADAYHCLLGAKNKISGGDSTGNEMKYPCPAHPRNMHQQTIKNTLHGCRVIFARAQRPDS